MCSHWYPASFPALRSSVLICFSNCKASCWCLHRKMKVSLCFVCVDFFFFFPVNSFPRIFPLWKNVLWNKAIDVEMCVFVHCSLQWDFLIIVRMPRWFSNTLYYVFVTLMVMILMDFSSPSSSQMSPWKRIAGDCQSSVYCSLLSGSHDSVAVTYQKCIPWL